MWILVKTLLLLSETLISIEHCYFRAKMYKLHKDIIPSDSFMIAEVPTSVNLSEIAFGMMTGL